MAAGMGQDVLDAMRARKADLRGQEPLAKRLREAMAAQAAAAMRLQSVQARPKAATLGLQKALLELQSCDDALNGVRAHRGPGGREPEREQRQRRQCRHRRHSQRACRGDLGDRSGVPKHSAPQPGGGNGSAVGGRSCVYGCPG